MKDKLKSEIQDIVSQTKKEGEQIVDEAKGVDVEEETKIDDEEEKEPEESPEEDEETTGANPVVQVPVIITKADLDKMVYNTHTMVSEIYEALKGTKNVSKS